MIKHRGLRHLALQVADDERAKVCRHLTERLPGAMQVEVKLLEEIPRSKGGKYEDFVNEVRR